MVATNLNLNRRGAPGRGCQASTFCKEISPLHTLHNGTKYITKAVSNSRAGNHRSFNHRDPWLRACLRLRIWTRASCSGVSIWFSVLRFVQVNIGVLVWIVSPEGQGLGVPHQDFTLTMKKQNKASHHNPLPASSRIVVGSYNPQPESKPRLR